MNDGTEPDYRFTLANERTFLAWVRTALALLAGARVVHQLIHFELRWLLMVSTLMLTGLRAVLSVGAYWHWTANQQAMRHGRPLPRMLLIPSLTASAALLSVVAILLIVLSG